MTKTLIIAEVGVNHNGLFKNCLKLIDKAKEAGADIVKFQTFKAENLTIKNYPKANYQKNYKKNVTQFNMLKKLELKRSFHIKLKNYCKKKNIEFLSSGFDVDDLEFLKKLNLKRFKIPSGEITNYLYLKKIASFKKEVILSTGMSTIAEIEKAVKILIKNGLTKKKIILLHCISEYPTKVSSANLNAIKTMQDFFKLKIGFSDHTLSLLVPSIAVALGASIIEKHITLNNNLPGPDHKSSLNPLDFKKMVNNIRLTENSLGNGIKKPNKGEKKVLKTARKSIVAKTIIVKGEKFSLENLTCKRPNIGISSMEIIKVIGKKSKKNYKPDDLIQS